MNKECIVLLLIIICVLIMLFNSKINLTSIFRAQIKVFINNGTNKTSTLDIFSFIVCPVSLSLIICLWYGFTISTQLAEILTTTFSLIFTLLFAFQAMLVGKKDSNNKVEKDVINQTFVSIVTASIFSLIIFISSVALMFVSNCFVIKVLTALVLALSFMTIMLLLMIIKRTFKVFMNDDKK